MEPARPSQTGEQAGARLRACVGMEKAVCLMRAPALARWRRKLSARGQRSDQRRALPPLQRAVRVFAVDANKLMKKPDLNKPAQPERKLFSEEESAAAATVASTSAR